MRVGMVVDGKTEYETISRLIAPITRTNGTTVKVLKGDFHPRAPRPQIVRSVARMFEQLRKRGFSKTVLVLDREDVADCAPAIARDLVECADRMGVPIDRVVVKDRCYENWLIADPDALQTSMPKRFLVSKKMKRQVVPNKADHVPNAVAWLENATIKEGYSKVGDAKRIVENISVDEVAANSRSFRQFVKVLTK